MSSSLYSDNQGDVDALARRVAALTSLSSKQAAVISRGLLGRKVLKIKSSSLGGLFRSIDKDIDTKRLRDEFIKSGLIERIDETGVDGRPAIYSINAKVSELIVVEGTEDLNDGFDAEEEQAPAGEPDAVKGAPKAREDVPAKDGSAETAQAGESVAEPVDDAREKQEAPVVASPEAAQKEARGAADDKPVPFVSKVGRGARVHRRMDAQKSAQGSERDHAEQQQKDVDAAVKGQKPAVHAMGSKKKRPSTQDATAEMAEKKATASKSAPASKKDVAPEPREEKHGHNAAPVHEGPREREASKDEQASASAKKESSASKRRRERPERRKGAQPARKQEAAPAPTKDTVRANAPASSESRSIVRVIRGQLAKVASVLPLSVVAQKDRVQYAKITRVDSRSTAHGAEREGAPQNAKRQLAHDFEAITTWIEQTSAMDAPYASRRQRAFEIFNDEKAFDGKRGERLFKRLNDRGVNVAALKITPSRPYHFTSFFGIGANKPFIMVENIDTYDEIARLLRGKSSVKLFGIRVSGVIFGSGCKASVSHALDDYLSDIGYGYDYVYYAGDIDREGARIVEQARAANNTKIRMHAGMYKAMLAAHKRRLKDGRGVERASENQGVPQNLARAIADLPMVTRVQFRNILREGGRIPQEILTSADYRDSSSGGLDRILNS